MAAPFLTGVRKIDNALAALPKVTAKQILRKGLRRAMKPMQAAAKEHAPVRSGELRRSIKLRAAKRSRRNANVITLNVTTSVVQAAKQEFGAPGAGIEARHYEREAFREKEAEVRRLAEEEIASALFEAVNLVRAHP